VDPQSGRIYVANADDGTVTVLAPPTITYGTPLEAALLGASSSIAGSFTYAPAPGEMLDAGMHSVTATFTPTDTANYDGGSIDTIVAVRRATPIVTVTGGTYTYDGQAHPAAGAVTGVNGETLGAPAFTYDGAAVPPVGVGTYAVVASFGGNGNYTPASSAGATIVIRPADTTPPTVTITNPSMDAMYPVDSASTADVVVEATDASGVPNLTVNGTAATMTSGTPQAGTWRATMPISLVAGGVVRFDAAATDAAGNTAPATLIVDNDGIPRAMDRDRTTGVDRSDRYSDDFDNGVTAGTLTRNRWTVELSNAAVAGGVHATASGSGTVAIVSACIGPKKQVRLNADGEAADITCDPTTGTITVTAVRAVTRIELREQLTSGLWQQFKMRTGQSMSVGSPAVAGTDNSEPIDSEILQIDGDGNEIVVGGYQLAPGARVDVSATTGADGTVGIRFEALSGTVTVTISGETRTLRQGEQVTLPVTGPVKTAPVITWPAPASIVYGTALGAAQLNASANVPGMFAYTPGAGTILPAGAGQVLSVAFTPADGAQYATAIATVQITVLPGFSVSDVTITEGNSTGATKQATVTVRLTAKSTEWVAIAYTTSDGSARKDVDYFTSPGTVWFAPGVVAQSVAIPIVQDTIGEATESFFVDFTAVINGASSQARAVVTIVNDDSSTQLFTSSADFAAGTIEGGVYLSETDDGEIMLAPQGSEFSGTSLPAGWTSALLAPDGSSFGADGRLIVNGAAVASPAATSSGQTLEFAAIFSASPGERAGFAASSATGAPMAMFVIGSDMELYARSVNGPRSVESLMGGIDWLGKPHRRPVLRRRHPDDHARQHGVGVTHDATVDRRFVHRRRRAGRRLAASDAVRERRLLHVGGVRCVRHGVVAEADDDQQRPGRHDGDDHLSDRRYAGAGCDMDAVHSRRYWRRDRRLVALSAVHDSDQLDVVEQDAADPGRVSGVQTVRPDQLAFRRRGRDSPSVAALLVRWRPRPHDRARGRSAADGRPRRPMELFERLDEPPGGSRSRPAAPVRRLGAPVESPPCRRRSAAGRASCRGRRCTQSGRFRAPARDRSRRTR
jgi:hypothetical protein